MLEACRGRYLRCAPGELPSVAELQGLLPLPVLAAIAGLLVGGAVLMGTIAFGGQKFFEWQLEAEQAQNSKRLSP